MRRWLAVWIALTIVLLPGRADAWGFEAHKYILSRAIPLLPPEIRPFFERFRVTIVEHAVDPDLWRTAGWEAEPPRHFVDMDAYGPYPFKQMPRTYEDAVARYGKDFVEKNGTLPWRTADIFKQLTEAFAQRQPYARENIKFFSSVISHYVGDAHVPFHAALNYDGQLTGQWGIHSRFETELFLRFENRMKVTPGPVVTIPDARDAIFDTLVSSFSYVQAILDADKALAQGREVYDDEYFERFFAKVQPVLERRLGESIAATASFITSAWNAAGRPTLSVEEKRSPRKIRRS